MSIIKECSFIDLIEQNIVEIPIIQREYAQGRKLTKVNDIREDFVKDLLHHIKENKMLHLGFVYGRTDGDLKKSQEKNRAVIENLLGSVKSYAQQYDFSLKTVLESPKDVGFQVVKFIPLDGQQRLTTLFLLFWYLHIVNPNNEAAPKWINNFFYLNRKSAMSFFNKIADYEVIQQIREHLKVREGRAFSEVLKDMKFFFAKWTNDSTVNGILVMLDEIDAQFQSSGINIHNVDLVSLKIYFDFLDLNELEQSDELYVKMNARGKQLTDFEHFKAWLQDEYSQKENGEAEQEEENRKWLKELWRKLDTDWLNFFWKNFNDKFSLLDDYFYNFIKHLALLYNFQNRSLYSKIRNTTPEKIEYISLKDYKLDDHLFFSIDCLKFIEKVFDVLLNDELTGKYNSLLSDIYCYPFAKQGSKLTDKFLKKDEFNPSLWDLVYYYSFVLFIISDNNNDEEFKDWMRLTRNLIYNTQIQNPDNFYNAISHLNYMMDVEGLGIYDKITKESFENKFDTEQFAEEITKVGLFQKSGFEEIIKKTENHVYFYGQINFLLNFCKNGNEEYNIEKFIEYSTKACLIFDDKIRKYSTDKEKFIIQRCLLIYGDYFPNKSSNYSFCLNDAGSLRTKNENWRLLFDDHNVNKFLKNLLDEVPIGRETEIIDFMQNKIKEFLEDCDPLDWRVNFIRNPHVFSYCEDGAIKRINDSIYDIRLLKGTKIIGYHCELRTYSFYLENRPQIHEDRESPLFLHPFKKFYYLDDKNTSAHPGFQIYDWSFNDADYKINVRFSLDNTNQYEIKFFENSLVQKKCNKFIEQILMNLEFNSEMKDDRVFYIHNCDSKDLKNILQKLCAKLNNLRYASV